MSSPLISTKHANRQIRSENAFKSALIIVAICMVILTICIFITLLLQSIPSIKALGFGFLYTKVWDPVNNVFGALPFLVGTLITSFLALLISVPFSFSLAIFLGEYYPKGWFSETLKNVVELIAAIPSVIYGFWGIFVLVPVIQNFEIKYGAALGLVPYGVGIFTSSLVLSIMVVPYAASMGREVIRMVPSPLKEGAYSLGATRWEVIRSVVLPYTKSGLFAGVLLSLGRALGETMAVTMVIGNTSAIPDSLAAIFNPGNTMASVIANEFAEASDSAIHLSALVELGLLLFIVTVIINLIGKRIISRFTNE